MCDYSLHAVATRPAQVGETVVTTTFRGTSTRGFASASEPTDAARGALCSHHRWKRAGAGSAFQRRRDLVPALPRHASELLTRRIDSRTQLGSTATAVFAVRPRATEFGDLTTTWPQA